MPGARTRPLINGPAHGMRIPIVKGLPRRTGIAVKLIDGGYALYHLTRAHAYYFTETVSERDVEPVELEELAK